MRRPDFSPVLSRRFPLGSGTSLPLSRTHFVDIPPRMTSSRARQRSVGRGMHLSESRAMPSRRRQIGRNSTISTGHGVRPISPDSSGLPRHGTIIARNLKVIESLPRAKNQTSTKRVEKSHNQSRPNSDNLGVISVRDIMMLAETISKLRNTNQHKPSAPPQNTNNHAAGPDHGKPHQQPAAQGGQAVVLSDASGQPIIISDPGVIPVDSVSPGIVALGPPGITQGVNVHIPASHHTTQTGASVLEIMAPLALVPSDGHERRNMVDHLISDSAFMSELVKTANNKNVPIDIANLGNLISNGAANTGNPEQNKMINNLLEATYKNILEETLENLKKRLMSQVEAQLETRRPVQRSPGQVIIRHI